MQPLEKRNVAVLGATGLIGSHLVEQLLSDSRFGEIHLLSRKPLDISGKRVRNSVLDFADSAALKDALASCPVVCCAVGTTLKQVGGDKERYREVDYAIPVQAARICASHPHSAMLLVSSVGADARHRNFYLSLKGEMETAVMEAGLFSLDIFRPSLLLGKRKEFRFGEKLAQLLMEPLAPLIPSRYKPIAAAQVAMAMRQVGANPRSGIRIHHFAEMVN